MPGNTKYTENISTPEEAWSLILDEVMLEMLLNSTNIYIESIIDKFNSERDAKELSKSELKAFIGLLYLCGLHKASHVNVRDL